MGKYNFDEIIDRHGTSCNKWEYNIPEGVLPMWVADMDFAAAPEIREAMQKRLDHPVYGYTHHSRELKDSIVSWAERRYHWEIRSEWLAFSPGVVPALVMSLFSLTNPGDRVLIMTPVYHPFYSAIEENGRRIINHPLICDENGRYSIDFDRLEAQIDSRCKVIMMCNPHNPVGRVWTREELVKISEIAERHGLYIISDEIHADFVFDGKRHIPMASVSEYAMNHTISAFAPSKTFNVAGLCQSYVVIPNKKLYDGYDAIYNAFDLGDNIFGMTALTAAFTKGEEWLNELLQYLEANRDFTVRYIREHIPQIHVWSPEGTYLLWLDCRELGLENDDLNNFFLEKAKVKMNAGYRFGAQCGTYMRLNTGCPRAQLLEALNRIETAVNEHCIRR